VCSYNIVTDLIITGVKLLVFLAVKIIFSFVCTDNRSVIKILYNHFFVHQMDYVIFINTMNISVAMI